MIKIFFWTLLFSLCIIIFETAILSNLFFLPVVPDLLLIVILYVSVNNNSLLGECSGFASGLMLDFFSASPLGLNALMRTIIGYFSGIFKEFIAVTSIFIPMLFAAAATLCKALLLWFLSFLFYGSVIPYNLFESSFWIELALNIVLAPAVFAFLGLFSSLLVSTGGGTASYGKQ